MLDRGLCPLQQGKARNEPAKALKRVAQGGGRTGHPLTVGVFLPPEMKSASASLVQKRFDERPQGRSFRVRESNPSWLGGANSPSLVEAQRTYAELGAMEFRFSGIVRGAAADEPVDAEWRPIDLSQDSFEPRGQIHSSLARTVDALLVAPQLLAISNKLRILLLRELTPTFQILVSEIFVPPE